MQNLRYVDMLGENAGPQHLGLLAFKKQDNNVLSLNLLIHLFIINALDIC